MEKTFTNQAVACQLNSHGTRQTAKLNCCSQVTLPISMHSWKHCVGVTVHTSLQHPLGVLIPGFQVKSFHLRNIRIVLVTSIGTEILLTRKHIYNFKYPLQLTMKPTFMVWRHYEMPGTTHPITQHPITWDMNPQKHYCEKPQTLKLTSWIWVWCISGWLLYNIPIWWLGLKFKFAEVWLAPRYFCCIAVS